MTVVVLGDEVSEVLSEAAAGLLRKTSPCTFFTMLTFSQILGVCSQWSAALGPAIVSTVAPKKANLWVNIVRY